MQKEYLKLEKIEGPLIVLKGVDDVSYDEMADIKIEGEEHRRAKVVRIQNDRIIAQVFEGTSGISTNNVTTRSEERRVGKECRSRWSPYH